MRYLVSYVENGITVVFYTEWFDVDNNFNEDIGMIVYDLHNDKFMSIRGEWNDIKFDHL